MKSFGISCSFDSAGGGQRAASGPGNNLAWKPEAARTNFSVVEVATPRNVASMDDLVTPFIEKFTPRTRMLALTHVSNDTGVRLPVEQLCAEARRRGVLTLVDGAQSLGVLEVDMPRLGMDIFTASLHSWSSDSPFPGERVCPHLYNSVDDLDRLVSAVKTVVRR